MYFGKKLKAILKDKNIRQIEFAKQLGISPSRLSNYLSNKREPCFELMAAMVTILGVSLDDIILNDDKELKTSVTAKGAITNNQDFLSKDIEKFNENHDHKLLSIPFSSLGGRLSLPNTKRCPFPSTYFRNVKQPEENGRVFLANNSLPSFRIYEGDHLLSAKCGAVKLSSGDFLIKTGRNAQYYTYFSTEREHVLVDRKSKKQSLIHDLEDINSLYKVMYVISRP